MDMVVSFMLMEMSTWESGKKIKQMEKEHIFQIVEQNIMGIGKMISKMEKVNSLGQIKLFTKVNIKMEKNMEKESLCGLTIVHI